MIPENRADSHHVIWGRQPVLEALRGFLKLQKIVLLQGARGKIIAEIEMLARERDVAVTRMEKGSIEQRISREKHQGVLAYLAPYEYFKVDSILQKARRKPFPFLLLLDHIQDPRNLGSLLRTASAAGVDGVIIPRDRASGLTPVVYKSSAGALAHVPVARVVNLVREADKLKKQGFWFMGADPEGEMPFYEANFDLPLVLVLGSEGKGLSRLLREKCDFLLHIPITGALSSLNVSVAGAIIIYEVFRRRLAAFK
jgi:23S rRNA (guanosine2251-2'-O)-methyltransferase